MGQYKNGTNTKTVQAKYKIGDQIEKWDNIKWTNFKNGSSQLKNDMLISKLAQA